MTGVFAILCAALLPSVPLPRGAVTSDVPQTGGASVTWEATGTIPLPYAEARAQLLTSLAIGRWRLRRAIPMNRQGVTAEILVFGRGDIPVAPANGDAISLYFTLQSAGPASVDFNYRRERRGDVPAATTI